MTDQQWAISHIHLVISQEYMADMKGMNRMFWACNRLERVKKKWGLIPPNRGYFHSRYLGGGENGRDNYPENGRADDYYEHGARS